MSSASYKSALIDVTGGTLGGISLVFVGHPFDTLKVRLQTQSVTNPQYSGLADCVRKTYAAEGFGGFYRGVASPLFGQAFLNAWQFGVWGAAKNIVAQPDGSITTPGFFKAGAITGLCVALLESPVDLFKTQLQTQVFKAQPEYTSFFGCVRSILSEYGLRGAMKGFSATAMRNCVAVSQYFGFYELAKQQLATGTQYKDNTLETWKLLIAGATGGIFYWLLVYPMDVVKSTIQAAPIGQQMKVWDTLKLVKQQNRMFSGFAPCMMRSLPANAVCFAVYETVVKHLNSKFLTPKTL